MNTKPDQSEKPDTAIRVLFVLPRIVAGGVERATLNLIDGLQKQQVDCCLALGRRYGELLDEAQQLTIVEEVAGFSKWLFAFGVLRVLRRYRPTHIVTAFADVSAMVVMARWLAGSRAAVIVGVHGTHQLEAAAGGWRVWFQYVSYGWLAGWVYRHCAAIVAVSDGVAADVRERYQTVTSRLTVINNPVLTETMRRRVLELPSYAPHVPPYRVVALGRLAYEKGFDVLLHAMSTIASRYDAQLEIYGEGIERQRLQALINALHLQDRATLRGNTLDPLGAVCSADVFVFPSRHEGFGVALVEALACGKQVVASDCPHGPVEILKAGMLGQLVAPEDPVALAQAIGRSLSGEITFAPEQLRKRAADFTAEAAVANYLALLRHLTPASSLSAGFADAR